MSRGTHSSGYFTNPWRARGELTTGVAVSGPALDAAERRSRLRRVWAPVALFVSAAAALAGFVWGTVATSTPATVPGQPSIGVRIEQVGPVPGDLDSGRDAVLSVTPATVVTTSP